MTFSVIVPTYNRVSLLQHTLESLYRQDFTDFEIIVVNDGSTDSTDAYMKSIAPAKHITYLRQENQGLAATRSTGLHNAKGTYVAFTDDDCVVPENWLSSLHTLFQEQQAVCIGGDCITGNPENPFAEANDLMQSYFKAAGNRANSSVPFFTGNNVAYTRAVLEQVGGPDRRFRMGAEDRDLLFRVSRTGGRIIYAPSIAVRHYNDSTFSTFIRHQFQFGEGSYLYYHAASADRPSSFSLLVYLGVFFAPFKRRSPVRALLLSLLIVLAQGMITLGYAAEWMRRHVAPPEGSAAVVC